MKRITIFPLLLPTILFMSLMACHSVNEIKQSGKSYKTPDTKLASDVMTPEVLWSFGRLSGPAVSPDGKQAVYGVTYFNKEEDRSYSDLYIMELPDGKIRQITDSETNESGAAWTPDGKKISYLADGQLWEMDPNGSGIRQVTDVEGGIGGYLYAPDMSKIAYLKEVKLEPDAHDLYPDLPKANARIIDDQFYRHWDHWVETYTHIFVAEYTTSSPITTGRDILEGEKWESPVRPFGGIEQLCWSPDGRQLVYTSRKKQGVAYALSTNTDLYRYDTESGNTTNLTEGMPGYDKNPIFSPDGQYIAWESMEREGYEADKVRLFVMDTETGAKKDYSAGFEQNAEHLVWSKDGATIWFISDWHATDEIYSLNLANGKIRKHTEGVHGYTSVVPVENYLLAVRASMSKPAEIYKVDPETGQDEEVSFINQKILSQLTMGKVEKRWVKTTDNQEMLVWMIYPPHFDPAKKYPAILYCQGGPQNTVSQSWSYRWNYQQLAANGYIVVAPNRRGLPGFGMEWLEAISGDYPGQCMQDYLSAIDDAAREPYVDADKLGCVGASFGGYSVYYLAGHHQKRFKAFIAHCGMFDMESKYLTTEEMWFPNWDLGGAPWEKENKTAQRTYANSPHKFVGNWDTPILVIHGQKDFRVDATQGMMAFNAARLRGIPARYLYYPEESHWVVRCQNGILWQRVFKDWLDKYLK